MRFFAMVSLSYMNSLQEVRFAPPVTAKFKHVTVIVLVRYYVVMTSRTLRCEISKKLTWNPTLTAKNTPLFLFPTRALASNICLRDALHGHVFSFTHNAVVLHILDVFTPKIRRKFLILTIYESKQLSLTQDLK